MNLRVPLVIACIHDWPPSGFSAIAPIGGFASAARFLRGVCGIRLPFPDDPAVFGVASPLIAGLGIGELYWRRPMIVRRTLLIVEVYNRTSRSIPAVWIFHGMMNVTGGWLRGPADMYPFMLAGKILAAAPVVPWWHTHTRGRFV